MVNKAIEVGRHLRSWAARKGLLTTVPGDHDEDNTFELSEVSTAAQAHAAEEILNIRKINLICVDEDREKVIIYTQKVPTKRELEELPIKVEGNVSLEFRKGALPVVRNSTGGPSTNGCSDLHNGRYTCGSSVFVGNRMGAGTLGCVVKDIRDGLLGLSNNHVTGGMSFSDTELPITAPGPLDVAPGVPDPFTLGHHRSALPLMLGSPDNANVSDNFDAAVFTIKDVDLVSSMQRNHYDTPSSVMAPTANIVVEKVGRTTGRTRGTLVGHAIAPEPVVVRVPEFGFSGAIYFEDFWIVEGVNQQDFARPGDSGAVVCFRPAQGQPAVVGLLFAANTTKSLTYIAPIEKVLSKLGVTIVSGHNI